MGCQEPATVILSIENGMFFYCPKHKPDQRELAESINRERFSKGVTLSDRRK